MLYSRMEVFLDLDYKGVQKILGMKERGVTMIFYPSLPRTILTAQSETHT